ncbi:hypothetical protein M3223_19450 [Paenibacillus pasadenensis]|uniref:hypothetical protein n=1 Tax=Paenibacillus pasadenensis TaxID=217090 RepID=UPI00203DC46B|nr:hypothetical protein [Paenibacillus pasadenensis]MCM3749533.1 hypothetical protein [Paenibacillus pasadenensis]
MHQKIYRALVLLVLAALVASGCAGNTETGTGRSEGGETEAAAKAKAKAEAESGQKPTDGDAWSRIKEATVADAAEGLQSSRSAVKDLKQAAEAGEAETLRSLTEQLAGIWLAIEADMKSLHADKAAAVRADLTLLLNQDSAESPVDVSYRLYQTYRDLNELLQGPST